MLTVTVVLVDRTSVDARTRSEDEDGESGELGGELHAWWLVYEKLSGCLVRVVLFDHPFIRVCPLFSTATLHFIR